MTILDTASNLDFNGWLRGLFSAGISGGASAVVGGFTVSGMDPKDYNFAQSKFYILVGALFVTNAVVSMAKFLANQPLPGMREMTKTVQTVTPPVSAGDPKVITTVTEKTVEPVPAPVSNEKDSASTKGNQ